MGQHDNSNHDNSNHDNSNHDNSNHDNSNTNSVALTIQPSQLKDSHIYLTHEQAPEYSTSYKSLFYSKRLQSAGNAVVLDKVFDTTDLVVWPNFECLCRYLRLIQLFSTLRIVVWV